jgi:hypothetical protein
VLQRGDEGQADGFARCDQLGGVEVRGQHLGVGDGLDPGLLGHMGTQVAPRRRRWPQVHGPRPPLWTAEHVQAHVGGDAIQPRPQGRPALKAVDAPPGPHHRLLDGVLGLEPGAQHPVAVAGQLLAVRLELRTQVDIG